MSPLRHERTACGCEMSGEGIRNSPGSWSVWPHTISAAEQSMYALRAVLIPTRTNGNSLNQLEVFSLALREAFSCRWNRSTIPLAWGWYAVVWAVLAPIMSKSCDQRSETNCHPLSDITSFGKSKHESQPERSALEQDSADVSTIGMASGQWVNLSIIVKMQLWPRDWGRGPTISSWMQSKQLFVSVNFWSGAMVWQWSLASWQAVQDLIQAVTSFLMPCHTKRCVMSFCIGLTPGCVKLWTV